MSEPAVTQVVAWHLGGLHAYETWLALGLAFGPFVLLALIIVVRRRDDDEDDVEATD
jgi:hypothetical protein